MQDLSRNMDALIVETVARARAAGLDSLSASRRAAQAVRIVRPDLTPDEAWALVELSAISADAHYAA